MIKYCLRCKSTNISKEVLEVNTFENGIVEKEVVRCHNEDCGTFSFEHKGSKYFQVPIKVYTQDKMASIASQMKANVRESSILK